MWPGCAQPESIAQGLVFPTFDLGRRPGAHSDRRRRFGVVANAGNPPLATAVDQCIRDAHATIANCSPKASETRSADCSEGCR